MSKTLQQIFVTNPITTNANLDLMYFMQSPYTAGTDAGMTYANFKAQFSPPITPAALTKTDDTNVTLTLGGSPTTALLAATSLTLGWTGTLSETRGGTGQSTYTLGDTLYSSASNTLSKLAGNTTAVKQYLSQTGTGVDSAAPVWSAISGGDITTGFTLGSVVFAGASGVLSQDNSKFFWDDTSFGLGIGTNTVTAAITVDGANNILLTSTKGDITFNGYSPNIYSTTVDLHLAFDGSVAKGNVGIGKAPSVPLDVNGVAAATHVQSSSYYNSDGNTTLTFTNLVGTPVNYFNLFAVATLNKPTFSVQGADSNIGMIISTKGAGQFQMVAATASPIQFNSGTSSQHTANFAFADAATTQTITFPDGNGTVAFVGDASFTWTTVAGTTQACAVDNGYVSGNAAQTTFTLPSTAAVGADVAVEGLGTAGWILTANSGQTIKIGTSTTTTAGSLTSAAGSDNVYVTCIVANTTWRVTTTNSAGLTIS